MFTYIALFAKNTRDFWKANVPTLNDVRNAGDPASNFALVRSITAPGLEEAFMAMQGEVWSPNGEARKLVMALGLNHTSMSVGDVFLCVENGWYFMVDRAGFIKIEKGA
jgi:hypothetical protein